MVIVSKFSNFPDELSENDELREFELSGSDCMRGNTVFPVFPRHVFGIYEIQSSDL